MRVCKGLFPNKEHPEKSGFYMDDRLVGELEVFLKNIMNDWDFTIIIAGHGEVRVGKSMLAMQIGCYWSYEIYRRYKIKVPFNVSENIVFDGRKLIEKGNKLGINHPYSCMIFDEAGADLEGRKAMQTQTQDVLDFFRECGQFNLLNILVIPEFFDLPKGIAVTRSNLLLNVKKEITEDGIFKRGYYYVHGPRSKKLLYMYGKKDLNYKAVRSDWGTLAGRFYEHYTVNKEEYKNEKLLAMKKRESKRRNRFQMLRDAAWFLLTQEFNMTQSELGKRMENLVGIYVPKQTISDAIAHYKMEMGSFTEEET